MDDLRYIDNSNYTAWLRSEDTQDEDGKQRKAGSLARIDE